MAIERCLNARAHLNIEARFSHSLQSCTPKGMMGTLSKIMLPAMVTELSGNAWCKTHSDEVTLMTWTPQSPDIRLFGMHSNAASIEKSIDASTFSSCVKRWCLSDLLQHREPGRSLAESLPRHVEDVIKAKGGPMRYWTEVCVFQVTECTFCLLRQS